MYKDQMDGNTILFIGETYSKAYSLAYINKNYNHINSNLQDVKEIYYKCNDSKDSWINYKKALLKEEYRHLSYTQKIKLGLVNDKIDYTKIPETEFTDYLGYTYTIGAGDGLGATTSIKKLMKVLPSNIKASEINEYYDKEHGKVISVDFKSDITNAIIILNGLFEPYHILNKTTVLYYEKEISGLPYDDKSKLRLEWLSIVPYIWENLAIVQRDLKPVRFDGNWFVFEEEIDSGCLLFYNGIMYFYEINKLNPKYIKITDLDIGNTTNFASYMEDVKIVRLRDENGKPVKQQKLTGFFNESDNKVYFPMSITNAIITYNGTVNNYIITPDQKSVKFSIPSDINLDFNSGIDEGSQIYAINFYSYNENEAFTTFDNYYVPQAELAKVANDIISGYKTEIDYQKDVISKLERTRELVFDDFEETLRYDKFNPNKFKLTYIPQEDSIKFHVNGVHYEKDVYFVYLPEFKTIEWVFTEMNGGFDITNTMEVGVIYDFKYAENGFDTEEKIEEFKKDYYSKE